MNLSTRSTSLTLVWLGLAFLILLLSVSIALFGPMAGVFGLLLAGGAVFFLMLQFQTVQNRNWMFIFMFVLPLVLGMARKVTGISPFGIWQLGIIVLACFGLKRFGQDIVEQAWLRWSMIVFIMFLVIGALSTLAGRSHMYGALYQLFSDLKPVLALALGYAFAWNSRAEKIMWFLVRWFWLPCLIMVAFEWLATGAYLSVFAGVLSRGTSVDPTGFFPSRATGVFEHPSFLAASGAVFALLALARALTTPTARGKYWFAALMNFSLIVCAVQRQEMAAALGAGCLVFMLAKPHKVLGRTLVAALLGFIASIAFLALFSKNLETEAGQWGYGTVGALQQPRAQIFSGAFLMAKTYFPLGSGLGTYGGAGAEKFDPSVYDQLGFRHYWWYGKEDFLMDTYWPNSIAETGLFGALTLLLSYFLLLVYAVIRAVRELAPRARSYWLSTTAMMAYMLMLSFSSPAFQDLRLFILPAMMFGIASTVSKGTKS